MAGQPRWAPARVRGLQAPYSKDQLGAMILYPMLTAAFYLITAYYLRPDQIPIILGIYSGLVVVSVACWFYVEMVDPAQPGGIPCPCMKYTQSHSRYCATCKKTVPGLDHHCLWLNTCIGTRNYFFFFILAIAGTLQFTLQTLVSIFMLVHWLTPPQPRVIRRTLGNEVHFKVVLGIHTAASGIALMSLGSLCVFHIYLQALGKGTYDWILSKRNTPVSTSNANSSSAPASSASGAGPRPLPQGSSTSSASSKRVLTNSSNTGFSASKPRPEDGGGSIRAKSIELTVPTEASTSSSASGVAAGTAPAPNSDHHEPPAQRPQAVAVDIPMKHGEPPECRDHDKGQGGLGQGPTSGSSSSSSSTSAAVDGTADARDVENGER